MAVTVVTTVVAARVLGRLWFVWHPLRAATRTRWSFRGHMVMVDLRYAIRSLLHAPAFALAAVFTLVLGIGVNLAVFSVVDRVLFRPLPFAEVDQLVSVAGGEPETGDRYFQFSKVLFVQGRSLPAIDDMAMVGSIVPYRIGTDTETPITLGLTEASFNLTDVLGVVPVRGRTFTREDALARRDVAMITFEAWRAQYGGDDSIIGSVVGSRNATKTIVGVLPPGFIAPAMNRVPVENGLVLVHELLEGGSPTDGLAPGVARLASGATIEDAQQQFNTLGVQLDPVLRRPEQPRGPRALVEPLRAGMFWYAWRYFWLVALAAALVGLLACANLACLLLARGRSREQQIALRASLGASRGRLMAAEFLQALTVCGVAAILSLGLVRTVATGLAWLVPGTYQPFVLTEIDGRLVGASVAAALLAAVIGGLAPTWRATRVSLVRVLAAGSGSPSHTRRSRAGGAVLAFEAAVGVVLVAGAAVAGRSFIGLVTQDVGFDTTNLHVVRTEPVANRQTIDPAVELARQMRVLDGLRQAPGVLAAAGIDAMVAAGAAPMRRPTWNETTPIGRWQVTGDFLAAVGGRLIAGRDLSVTDINQPAPVAVITESAAAALWPGVAPIEVLGRELTAPDEPRRTVVGVVADMRDRPTDVRGARVFVPLRDEDMWRLEFPVRMRDARPPDPEALREALSPFGVTAVRTQPAGREIDSTIRQPRVQAIIFGAFALTGMLLAALGLFAVASFDLALRKYEMGVRLALGATSSQVRRLAIGDALRPVAVGLAIGLVAAWWAGRYMQALVHQVDARDPWTYALVALVLIATAVVAAWLPARRAAKTDPASVLRAV